MKKYISFLILLITVSAMAQPSEEPENWFTLHPETDQVQGVSADLVHEMLKGRDSRTVIVAVIDSGVDIEHEDLQGKIWKNEDEIADNGIDDDKNGYVDDVYGWNFIGGKDGENVDADTYELTREYARLKPKYEDKTQLMADESDEEYNYWLEIQEKFEKRATKAMREFAFYKDIRDNARFFYDTLSTYLETDALTIASLKAMKTEEDVFNRSRDGLLYISSVFGEEDLNVILEELDGIVEYYEVQVEYGYNVEFNPREIVGDNWEDGREIGYGNTDVEGPDAGHGTHVAGIIAAVRDNDLGIRGIAENVLIMPVRAVPNGDERDKDVANAIRYAVDNGAHIINMSFGKSFNYRYHLVEEAILYAQEKDVLMIHAAGNSNKNLDENDNFPTPNLSDGSRAELWLEIGAAGYGSDADFVGSFSNYGKESVDLFAPGVRLTSTTPNDEYESNSGTSMAAPATSGVAAIIMSYFPDLSARQVKDILVQSVRKFEGLQVKKPGGDELVAFSDLSITGGLVNAVEAVKLAEEMSKGLGNKK
jgi:subtilisin family serine protease